MSNRKHIGSQASQTAAERQADAVNKDIRPQLGELILTARDAILAAADLHDSVCPELPGECISNAAMAAYLAHCLGIWRADKIDAMVAELRRHNRECPNCTCGIYTKRN